MLFRSAMRAGLLSLVGEEVAKSPVNTNIYFAVAVMGGLFTEFAHRKLRNIALQVFGLEKNEVD